MSRDASSVPANALRAFQGLAIGFILNVWVRAGSSAIADVIGAGVSVIRAWRVGGQRFPVAGVGVGVARIERAGSAIVAISILGAAPFDGRALAFAALADSLDARGAVADRVAATAVIGV